MQGGSPERLGAFQHPGLCSNQLHGLLLGGNTEGIQPGSMNPAVLSIACAQDTRTVLAVWFDLTISYSLGRKVTARYLAEEVEDTRLRVRIRYGSLCSLSKCESIAGRKKPVIPGWLSHHSNLLLIFVKY